MTQSMKLVNEEFRPLEMVGLPQKHVLVKVAPGDLWFEVPHVQKY